MGCATMAGRPRNTCPPPSTCSSRTRSEPEGGPGYSEADAHSLQHLQTASRNPESSAPLQWQGL